MVDNITKCTNRMIEKVQLTNDEILYFTQCYNVNKSYSVNDLNNYRIIVNFLRNVAYSFACFRVKMMKSYYF